MEGEKVPCADPMEPDEGNSRAVFLPDCRKYGKACVYSHLHGGIQYKIQREVINAPDTGKTLSAFEARRELNDLISNIINIEHPEIIDGEVNHTHSLVKSSAGLGKSTTIIKQSIRKLSNRFIEYYAPSLSLCDELADQYRKEGVQARVIRGRNQLSTDGRPMCLRAKEAEKLGKKGISIYSSLCRTKNKDGVEVHCPYYSACKYIDQFKGKEKVRFYPINRVSMDRGMVDSINEVSSHSHH